MQVSQELKYNDLVQPKQLGEDNPIYVDETNEKISKRSVPVWLHLLTLPISSQVTRGLAKIFNFEILQHGTSFQNVYGIFKNGADPSKGGSEIGSTQFYVGGNNENAFIKNAQNHFYVFKDSEAKKGLGFKVTKTTYHPTFSTISGFQDEHGTFFEKQQFKKLSFLDKLELELSPRFHAAFSSISQNSNINNRIRVCFAQVFYGVTNFFFSPTLRFIYTLDETKTLFEDDPDYAGYAYRTTESLPNSRIGLIGVCKHAKISGIIQGVQKRPLRIITGVIQLAAGTVFTCTGLGFLI